MNNHRVPHQVSSGSNQCSLEKTCSIIYNLFEATANFSFFCFEAILPIGDWSSPDAALSSFTSIISKVFIICDWLQSDFVVFSLLSPLAPSRSCPRRPRPPYINSKYFNSFKATILTTTEWEIYTFIFLLCFSRFFELQIC